MKCALTSVNPPHTNNIFDGLKGVEWRTKPMPTGKHYCYETKKCFGIGKVIGEFTIWRIKKYENISQIPEGYIDLGCVPVEFLEGYSKGRPLYAHFIISPKRYDKPRELSEFIKPCIYGEESDVSCFLCDKSGYRPDMHIDCFNTVTRPPQSWCYVEGE